MPHAASGVRRTPVRAHHAAGAPGADRTLVEGGSRQVSRAVDRIADRHELVGSRRRGQLQPGPAAPRRAADRFPARAHPAGGAVGQNGHRRPACGVHRQRLPQVTSASRPAPSRRGWPARRRQRRVPGGDRVRHRREQRPRPPGPGQPDGWTASSSGTRRGDVTGRAARPDRRPRARGRRPRAPVPPCGSRCAAVGLGVPQARGRWAERRVLPPPQIRPVPCSGRSGRPQDQRAASAALGVKPPHRGRGTFLP